MAKAKKGESFDGEVQDEAAEFVEQEFVETPREAVVKDPVNAWGDAQKLRDEVREGLARVGREAGKLLDRVSALNSIDSNTPWNSLSKENVDNLRKDVKVLIG